MLIFLAIDSASYKKCMAASAAAGTASGYEDALHEARIYKNWYTL